MGMIGAQPEDLDLPTMQYASLRANWLVSYRIPELSAFFCSHSQTELWKKKDFCQMTRTLSLLYLLEKRSLFTLSCPNLCQVSTLFFCFCHYVAIAPLSGGWRGNSTLLTTSQNTVRL